MDKQTVAIVVLLGILVIFWMPIMTQLGLMEPPQERPQIAEQTSEQTPTYPSTSDNQPSGQVGDPNRIETSPTLDNSILTDEDETTARPPEESIVVETNVLRVVFTSYGGAPKSIKLNKYTYMDGPEIEMLPDCGMSVPSFIFNGGAVDINSYAYQSSQAGSDYMVRTGSQEISFSYFAENGDAIVKRYRLYADRYDFDLIIEINNRNSFGFERDYWLKWGNKLSPTELNLSDDYMSMWGMALMGDEGEKFDDYDNNMFDITLTGNTHWVATRSKYFTALIVPRSRIGSGVRASGIEKNIMVQNESIDAREINISLQMEMPYEAAFSDSFSIFVGPLDYELLKNFDETVVDIVDIGTTPYVGWIIKIFAVPIMWLLPRMYSIVPNYGVVIILFSLLVKLITWPLSKKTVHSMNAMKELQPEMAVLKEKHKKNPQALNREMMKLYKERGINPLSGCLPFLPQMPLFFALFAVFRSTILLRQAPFILWWNDLSRGALSVTDPYIILVVLMAGLMFVQQKMAMTDPKNKAMIYMMPAIMGFFFYKAAAGLVLYWSCFSLFSFIEQIVFRKSKPKVAVTK